MSGHMRTTIRLADSLLREAKQLAKERDETLTDLIEQGLRLLLARARPGPKRARVTLPVSSATGGTLPGVNLDDSAGLLDLMEGRR